MLSGLRRRVRSGRVPCAWLPALVMASALSAAACGGHTHGTAATFQDRGRTPAYGAFLHDLQLQGASMQPLGLKQFNGHWSSAESVAAEGCQCAQTWATLYVEHRLRVDGQLVVVDEEVTPGATADLGAAGSASGADSGQHLHRYRRDNLLVITTSSNARLLDVLNTVLGAAVAE